MAAAGRRHGPHGHPEQDASHPQDTKADTSKGNGEPSHHGTGAGNLALRKKVTRVGRDMAERDVRLVAVLARCGAAFRGQTLELQQGIVTIGDAVIVWGGDAVEVDPRAPASGYREPPLRRVLAGDQRNPVRHVDRRRASFIPETGTNFRLVVLVCLRRG